MQDAPAAIPQPNLLLRNDTFLGICEAIGQDFGFHANWLRILFAVSLYWFPAQVVAAYLGLGLIVLASRLAAPDRRTPAAEAAAPPAGAVADSEAEALPLAA